MARYSVKAQPYLDAIAQGFFRSSEIRDWMIAGTAVSEQYSGAFPLHEEQRKVRKSTIQPFWANYWCGKDKNCTCRIEGSKSLESDAIFFLRNVSINRTLAIHVEFKRSGEKFKFGQPEGYPLRAKCFSETHSARRTLNAHDDWTTVLFCGEEALSDKRIACFQRVITHADAAAHLESWPS